MLLYVMIQYHMTVKNGIVLQKEFQDLYNTSGSATQLITPASVCFNSAGASTTYLKIVNKSAGTANVQVTLTFVGLES